MSLWLEASDYIESIVAYEQNQGCGRQAALRDMLTDIRLVADEMGLDFDYAIEGSYKVYMEEKELKSMG